MYYRKANAAMLVYDITSLESFYDIKDWVKGESKWEKQNYLFGLVGYKSAMFGNNSKDFCISHITVFEKLTKFGELSYLEGLTADDVAISWLQYMGLVDLLSLQNYLKTAGTLQELPCMAISRWSVIWWYESVQTVCVEL